MFNREPEERGNPPNRKRRSKYDRVFLTQKGELSTGYEEPGECVTTDEGRYAPVCPPDRVPISDDEDSVEENDLTWQPSVPKSKPDTKLKIAQKRNLARIRMADELDEQILGEYLPCEAAAFFPMRMVGPDDHFSAPSEWVERVELVASTPCSVPGKPAFRFDLEEDSLEANGRLLEASGFDFQSLLGTQKGTTAWHGSEFRPMTQVKSVLGDHPILEYLDEVFTSGMEYRYLWEISEEERVAELEAQIQRGNHKSATEEIEVVQKLLAREVHFGFSLPFKAELVTQIKGAAVQPCGLAAQFGLLADGTRKVKKRLTHDLTHYITGWKCSVNERIDMSRYPEMFYGWCLLRTIHFIVCLRATFPGEKIFITKYDYSDAYRRMSQSARAAIQSILILAGIAFMALRLAFGGSPNPACFCAFSEALTDLANELSCSEFEPKEFVGLFVDPNHLVPKVYPRDDEPFGVGIPPAVEVPVSLDVRKDCFIDDIIVAFLGTERNLRREGHTVPLAAHVLSRPHAGDEAEPVPRKPLFAPSKQEIEGIPCEIMILLGWWFDTRRLIVSLPQDKFLAWTADLSQILMTGRTTVGELDSTVGRLNHASFLVPLSRHFLNDLRLKVEKNRKARNQSIRLSAPEMADVELWLRFLRLAHQGISMNLLTIRRPTRIAWSDSCPFGLGGYTQKGFGWRLRIPVWASFFGDDAVNNVLEFLGMAVSVKLLIIEGRGELHPCLLPLGDNTSRSVGSSAPARSPPNRSTTSPSKKSREKSLPTSSPPMLSLLPST
jgi:hypothetical protein